MPSISSLHVDTSGWQLKKQSDTRRVWINRARDVLTLEFFPTATSLPTYLHDAAGWLQYYQGRVQHEGGAVVSIDLLPLDGLDAVRALFKFRNPKLHRLSPLGMTYLGSWMLPRAHFSYIIKVQCFEYGATGTREAAVAVKQADGDVHSMTGEPPRIVSSADEWLAELAKSPVTVTPSDDAKYDATFPLHPLTRARSYLRHIQQTAHIDNDVRNSKPSFEE
ncbi:MAG TPA: hypothetical protein VHZ51_26795 [Ktedonobacteraceae bacterium]|jgi:hypothetical protein|nr:hypothetical protein [Ktedonobacteraceae bacterium]